MTIQSFGVQKSLKPDFRQNTKQRRNNTHEMVMAVCCVEADSQVGYIQFDSLSLIKNIFPKLNSGRKKLRTSSNFKTNLAQ